MATPSTEKVELYRGSIEAELPKRFTDVRKFRQVPDHQEVWIDKDGFTTIIFDICERVGPSGSSPEIDAQALTDHLKELVEEDIDTVKVWSSSTTLFSKLDKVPAYTLMATTQTPRRDTEASSEPDFTAIIMSLVRLEEQKTDILITINVPHIPGEYDEDKVDFEMGKHGELIGGAIEYAAAIWSSFEIKDWELFGEGSK